MRKFLTSLFFFFFIFEANLCMSQEVLYCFDFGGAFQDVAYGFTPVSRVYHSPRFLWIDNVREVERMDVDDALRRDFVGGQKGEFWVGLDNGDYQIKLILGDYREPKGPFDIYVQDQLVQKNIQTAAGKFLEIKFTFEVTDQKLRLLLQAEDGSEFAINGAILSGGSGKSLRRIFNEAPPDFIPTVDEVLSIGSTDARSALRNICDWFLAHRLPNGFLGDYEPGEKATQFYWYTTAYPIRTLLAGYEIFLDQKYLDAVTQIMDVLVDEQLPNGAWQQIFRNKPTKKLSKKELEEIYQTQWMNMADIGCIATALGISCHYVAEPRKNKYIKSLQRFCEDWALKWQKPSGGFTNAMESGVAQTEVYSTATATEAATFAMLYLNTGDEKYLKIAEQAAHFMVDHWNEDGRPKWYFHHSTKEGQILDMPINYFGAAFYYTDGIFLVYHHTKDQSLREKVERVYSWYIKGEKGLLANLGQNSWWQLQDAWNNSKTAGIPLAFLNYQRMANDPAVNRFVSIAKRFLCTPLFSQRLGVMVEDANLPWGGHSLQSWAACSLSATGFAGLSIAEMIQPGVIYLKKFRE
jgi:rhamnogalacturonyl hydrolase YesR